VIGEPRRCKDCSCKDCNGYGAGPECRLHYYNGYGVHMGCRLHYYFLQHELFQAGVDCWHPKGTVLVYEERQEKAEVHPEAENKGRR